MKDLILDFADFDLDHVVADIEVIRRFNPHRGAMEHLSAVVYEDDERQIFAGYKEVGDDEFWVAGHMPGMPVMPGVIMVEAAAQLCSYYAMKHDLADAEVVGLGGLEKVRFRNVVRPGERLVLVAEVEKVRRRAMIVFRFQGFVRQSLVVEGQIKGIPLPVEELRGLASGGSAAG